MIRAAFPVDRRRNASMSPTATVSAASPTARSDQSCAPSRALVLATETVRGSWCRRSRDAPPPESMSLCFPPGASLTGWRAPMVVDGELPNRRCRRPVVADSGAAGPASAWPDVLCGDATDRAAGWTVTGCRCSASTALVAAGASATAGASMPVGCSVGVDVCAARAVAAAGVASITGGAVSASTDSAAADETRSGAGAEPAAGATRGGSRLKGST
jgi:hypothetical protein